MNLLEQLKLKVNQRKKVEIVSTLSVLEGLPPFHICFQMLYEITFNFILYLYYNFIFKIFILQFNFIILFYFHHQHL